MRILKCFVIALMIVAFSATGSHAQEDTQRPNIIFILTDDLGYGDVGVFYQLQRAEQNDPSEPWMFTPCLDKMAVEGAKFTHQYSSAPVCAPSRASLLSGHTQGHANIRNNQFDKAIEDNYNMANVLKHAGYSTAVIGKWGLQGSDLWEKGGDSWPAHPLHRGFDYFFGYMRHSDGHEHYPKESIYREVPDVWENKVNVIDKLDKSYTTDLWTAVAKKWIHEHVEKKQEEPFFLYLSYDTPHAVLELPTQEYPEGGGLHGGVQWTGKAGEIINTAKGTPDSWTHPDYEKATYDHDKNPETPEIAWPDTYKRYATSVRRIDDAVGDLMKLLKDLDIDSNTLIVFTSDNGPSIESYLPPEYDPNLPTFFNSFGPFDGIKRDSWEGGLRVPTIVRWPSKIQENKTIEAPSALYDWMPTFAEAAGLSAPARIDGVSLLPSLTGKKTQKESLIYVEYFEAGKTPGFEEFSDNHKNRRRNEMQMIRFEDHVGVRYDIQSHDDDFEIYDVVKDPQQTKNLAESKEMKDLQRKMKDRVLQVRRPDTAARRPYDGELIPALTEKVESTLKWALYEGDFKWIPNTESLEAEREGEIGLYSSFPQVEKGQLLALEGHLYAPQDGEYTFYIEKQGKILAKIHEALVLDRDYDHTEKDVNQEVNVLLKTGFHPFKLYYIPEEDGEELMVYWKIPGGEKELVSFE